VQARRTPWESRGDVRFLSTAILDALRARNAGTVGLGLNGTPSTEKKRLDGADQAYRQAGRILTGNLVQFFVRALVHENPFQDRLRRTEMSPILLRRTAVIIGKGWTAQLRWRAFLQLFLDHFDRLFQLRIATLANQSRILLHVKIR
jgi:hypothetical protein